LDSGHDKGGRKNHHQKPIKSLFPQPKKVLWKKEEQLFDHFFVLLLWNFGLPFTKGVDHPKREKTIDFCQNTN